MLNTFEKTRAHEARRAAIQRQMEAMEVAASGRNIGSSSSATTTQTLTARKRSTAAGDSSAPAGSLETARRFLWDEDDEDEGYPSQMTSGARSGRNVYSSSAVGSRGSTGGRSGFLSVFRSGASGSSQRMSTVNLDASQHPVTKGSADKVPCGFLGRFFLKCFLSVGAWVAWFRTRTAMACGNGRGLKCFVLLAIVVTVVILVAVFLPGHSEGGIRGGPDDISNTNAVPSGRYKEISNRIISAEITEEKTLLSSGTPQNKALLWITNDDPANMAPSENFLLERYSLAVFYYATHGDNMFQTAVVNLTSNEDGKTKLETTDGGIGASEGNSGVLPFQPPADGEVESFGDDLAGQPNWLNEQYWLSGKGYCSWHGVECHHRHGTSVMNTRYDGNGGIILLNMTENNVRGMVPPEIFKMNRDLRFLSLSGNGFFGTVPTEISMLTELRFVSLANNFFTGTLPNSIHKLTELNRLYLDGNYFQGKLPARIGDLSNLLSLSIYNNAFTGTISTEIVKLRNLTTLYLDVNRLEGQIPSELGTVNSLVDLRLRHNKLTGTIPSHLGDLTRLEILYLDRNTLTGRVPTELGNAVRMNEMHLYRNKLSGPIPVTIGMMHDLTSLYLDNNHLTGGIPSEFGNLNDLEQLFIHKNYLNGTMPSEIGKMQSLRNFRVYTNGLVGSIPSEIGMAWKLEYFYVQDNILTGTVPATAGELNNLQKMRLYWNKLHGSVPSEVCRLMEYKLTELKSDCSGDKPKIVCSCCTACFT